jgi:hypothetical protein
MKVTTLILLLLLVSVTGCAVQKSVQSESSVDDVQIAELEQDIASIEDLESEFDLDELEQLGKDLQI